MCRSQLTRFAMGNAQNLSISIPTVASAFRPRLGSAKAEKRSFPPKSADDRLAPKLSSAPLPLSLENARYNVSATLSGEFIKMIRVKWEQHAVGHGGFHTGRADCADPAREPFIWVYDCGAKRHAQFAQDVVRWVNTQSTHVDWLFVSHFDSDHVSGLDTLMSRIEVRDVMLPYVDMETLAVALVGELGRGNCERWFVEMAADPARWFLSRGASRVTFLNGPGSGAESAGDFEPRPDEGKGWKCKIQGRLSKLTSIDLPEAQDPVPVRVAEDGTKLVVWEGDQTLRFDPFCHPLVPSAHSSLLTALLTLIPSSLSPLNRPGLGSLAYALAAHARTAGGRAELRAAYKAHAGSSNRSSLSLLSVWECHAEDAEPLRTAHIHRGIERSIFWQRGRNIGWLNTGDAELLDSADLFWWQAHYATELANVRVLSLPHHGSDRNSDEALQALCPSAVLTVHVKAGSSKHPGSTVRAKAGDRLVSVTNDPATKVRMVI